MVNNYRDVIKSDFVENPLVESSINSFNSFTEKGIQKVVDEIGDIIPTVIPQEVNSYLIKLKKAWVFYEIAFYNIPIIINHGLPPCKKMIPLLFGNFFLS